MIERRLSAWVEAGLIDATTANRISAWEADHARPLALWAVFGIGALAIGLGLISVIAANWAAIPATLRLAVHFAALILTAALLWRRKPASTGDSPWAQEALLFVFGALGLTFLGHLGQAYQTTSPVWQALAIWLALFAPLFLLRGQSWLTALSAAGMLIAAVWSFASGQSLPEKSPVLFGLFTGLPIFLAPLGTWQRGVSQRVEFWRRIDEIGFAYVLSGASIITVVGGFTSFAHGGDSSQLLTVFVLWTFCAAVAAAIGWWTHHDVSDQSAAMVIGTAGLVPLLTYPLSGSQIGGALTFMTLWSIVAWMALRGSWRGFFQLAVGVLALRLIVLSFELADNLLSSGAGLIASGLMILGAAFAAVRVAQRFAPPREAKA